MHKDTLCSQKDLIFAVMCIQFKVETSQTVFEHSHFQYINKHPNLASITTEVTVIQQVNKLSCTTEHGLKAELSIERGTTWKDQFS